MRFLDPVALAKLKSLSLELRGRTAEAHSSGRHRSLWKGVAGEFSEHRAYAPGDEVKNLDWKVYARQDRFYVREYRAESVLATHILLDRSGSMAFASSGRPPKWEEACRLAMALAYLVVAKGDSAGLVTFDVEPKDVLPPRSSFGALEMMDALLSQGAPGGETDLSRALELCAARLRRRSLVVLISDLLGEPEGVLKVVKAFQARQHEVRVLQVLDPCERDFDYEGPVLFESLEGGKPFYCEAGALRRLYRGEFERFLRLYEASFHRCGIPYASVFTDLPWDASLGRFLSRWP